ncbi:MAG: polysaccharide deacetylase family protein [Pseudomonadota bacterium]|uniref:polysaccharide deacetylase family protein n=1 Tax=Polaromonas sp. TaxID=1869339 RepID=UPI00183B00D8|nr:polysaccharide deacetylase family protein [Polaromonas sp.]MBA3592386.1 polysaccharide deacetylase family protein [Polaromonas sp.]MDQ3272328.1 polysaccharide deacetylase family protein [Pseudomonadota bacterium]
MLDTARPSPSIPILVYHQISEAPPRGAPFRGLYVSPGAFARQMALLKLLGYQGLSMSALLPYLKGQRSGKVVGITFDDGYLNNLTHALPVLQRHGFSSTCYAVSKLLGQTNVWDQGIGIAQVPLMDASQLRQWTAGGQEVGSHTQNHVRLLQSDAPTAQAEMTDDKAALETVMGTSVQHFCYPYGEYAPEHVVMAREAGFETATTTRRGRSTIIGNLLELPRVPVVRSTSLPVFWLKIATGYEDRERA